MSFVGVCVWFFLRACGNGVPTCATYRHSDDELRVPVHPRVAACVCIYCIESASRKEAAFRPSLALISPYFVSSTPNLVSNRKRYFPKYPASFGKRKEAALGPSFSLAKSKVLVNSF